MSNFYFENLPSTKTPVNANNLNKLNNVVINKNTPTTGEEIWIKKGKNLININKLHGVGSISNTTGEISLKNVVTVTSATNTSATFKSSEEWNGLIYVVDVQPNTTYTIKYNCTTNDNDYMLIHSYTDKMEHVASVKNTADKQHTFTTGNNVHKIAVCIEIRTTINSNITISNLQMEQNNSATAFEIYTDKEILVKNNNGVYEEFYKNEHIPMPLNIEKLVGSTFEFSVIGYRIGKLCLVNVYGNGEGFTTAWHDYELAKIIGISARARCMGVFSNQQGQTGTLIIEPNTNVLKLNYYGVTPTSKNSWIRGQIMFVCN